MASSASAPSPAPPLPFSPSPKLSFTELFNKWIQSIGIIVAAIWGAYTFIYKEIILPKAAPDNITINLQLKRLGAAKHKTSLVPVEMRISATNPSSQRVYLLPNKWMVWGYKTAPRNDDSLDAFYARAADSMNKRLPQVAERYARYGEGGIVAGGGIFPDNQLNPGETLTRTIIFYVPLDQYDSIFAQTVISSFAAPSGLALEWKFDNKSQSIQSTLYVIESNQRRLAKKDENGEITDPIAKKLGFEVATSSTELSLWE